MRQSTQCPGSVVPLTMFVNLFLAQFQFLIFIFQLEYIKGIYFKCPILELEQSRPGLFC